MSRLVMLTMLLSAACAEHHGHSAEPPAPAPPVSDLTQHQTASRTATLTANSATAPAPENSDGAPIAPTTDDTAAAANGRLMVDQVLDTLIQNCEDRLRVSNEQTFRALAERLDVFASQQRKLETAVKSLETTITQQGGLTESVNDLRRQHTTFKQALGGLSKNQTNLQESLRNVAARESSLATGLSILGSKQATLQGSLHDLSSDHDQIRGSVTSLLIQHEQLRESAINETKQEINMQANIKNYKTANISNRLAAVEDKLDSISLFASHLGFRCQNSADCSPLASNSMCGSNGVCACAVGFHTPNGYVRRCIPTREGDPCSRDSQCRVHTANSVCSNGACGCPESQWNLDNRECRPKVGLDQPCSHNQDCQAGECVSGRCKCPTRTYGDYEYRLAGTRGSCHEGRVAVRRAGQTWGHVCDDGWDDNDAGVFCRSLGFTSGTAVCCSKYGGSSHFHMDELKCTGGETHLERCSYRGWGRDNCVATEVAGVVCHGA